MTPKHPDAAMNSKPGPYTCMSCTQPTDNDDDLCDDCRREPMTPRQVQEATHTEGALYRKKPVVIEAWQWNESLTLCDYLKKRGMKWSGHRGHVSQPDLCCDLRINTLEGAMTVQPGDWIIRGVKGEFYPCKPDIFAATYEPALTRSAPAQGEIAEIRKRHECDEQQLQQLYAIKPDIPRNLIHADRARLLSLLQSKPASQPEAARWEPSDRDAVLEEAAYLAWNNEPDGVIAAKIRALKAAAPPSPAPQEK